MIAGDPTDLEEYSDTILQTIIGSNTILQSWFCKDELDPNFIIHL